MIDPSQTKLWAAVILQTLHDFGQAVDKIRSQGPQYGWEFEAMRKRTIPGLKAHNEIEHLWYIVRDEWFDQVCDMSNLPKCKVMRTMREAEATVSQWRSSALIRCARQISTWMMEENPANKDETLDQGFERAYAKMMVMIHTGEIRVPPRDLEIVRTQIAVNGWIRERACGRIA